MINKLANIVVVGQGAMGLLWYHHLSQASSKPNTKIKPETNLIVSPMTNVRLLTSDQVLLSNDELTSASYQFTPYQQRLSQRYALHYCQANDIEAADVILLCLKAYQISAAIKKSLTKLSAKTIIVLAHNGMGTFEDIVPLLSSKQMILALLTTHGCLRSGPLAITHTGSGQSDIGLLSAGGVGSQQAQQSTRELAKQLTMQLAQKLDLALPTVTFHRDILKKQWLKLAINCVINPITALNNIDNGVVNSEQFTEKIHALLAEITQISKAQGIDLVLEDLKTVVSSVAKATEKNCSSMRCDVLAGKPTEIDYINGYIHRLGQKYGIATPENTQMWQQVLTLSAKG
ncbi:MAG: 2-dehydropantoate 2-reductase [Colwellia sp.]